VLNYFHEISSCLIKIKVLNYFQKGPRDPLLNKFLPYEEDKGAELFYQISSCLMKKIKVLNYFTK